MADGTGTKLEGREEYLSTTGILLTCWNKGARCTFSSKQGLTRGIEKHLSAGLGAPLQGQTHYSSAWSVRPEFRTGVFCCIPKPWVTRSRLSPCTLPVVILFKGVGWQNRALCAKVSWPSFSLYQENAQRKAWIGDFSTMFLRAVATTCRRWWYSVHRLLPTPIHVHSLS